VLTKLASLTPDERARGVIAASAGNHAGALAWAAAREGIDCLVVMWQGASEIKRAAAEGYGAKIDQEAAGPHVVFERLAKLQQASGRVLVHAFDDPEVIAGQGTVGLELAQDLPDLDVVLVPTGGGGLVGGIATALEGVRVVAVEPVGAATLHRTLATGEPARIVPESIADGLNAPFSGELAIEISKARGVETATVTEDEIRAGFRFLYQRAKLAAEPGGAAGVGALLAGKVDVSGARAVAVVVSGGNVDPKIASDILSAE
jgi:threonine dehydratase